jgi:ATP-dependent protease ClpP protease subunit
MWLGAGVSILYGRPLTAQMLTALCKNQEVRFAEARAKGLLPRRGANQAQAKNSPAPAPRPGAARKAATTRQPPLPYNVGVLPLTDEIGPDSWVSAATVARRITSQRTRGARALLMEVNSIGGDCVEAFKIGAQLRRVSGAVGPVVAYVGPGAEANSAATAILLEADYIVLDPAASITIHAPRGGEERDRRWAQNQLEALYRERTVMTANQIHGLLDACGDTTFHAGNAITYGVADEVAGRERALVVARACAASAPLWPSSVSSPRRAVLSGRGVV